MSETEKRIPFAFAEANGVLIADEKVIFKGKLSASVLLELQRYLGHNHEFQRVPDGDFNKIITAEYQSREGAAQRAVDDLGAEMDLSQIANDLQSHTDLLAGDDDAPVIRLINAILTQAVVKKLQIFTWNLTKTVLPYVFVSMVFLMKC